MDIVKATTSNTNAGTTSTTNASNLVREVPLPPLVVDIQVLVTSPTIYTPQNLAP